MKRKWMIGGLGIILSASILSGCQSTEQANSTVLGQVSKTKINGEKINTAVYEERVNNSIKALQSWGIPMGEKSGTKTAIYDAVLNNMITEILVLQKGKELNMTVSKEEKETSIKEIKKFYPKLEEEKLGASFESKILNNKIVSYLYKESSSSEQEISDYYQNNKEKFKKETTYRLNQILLDNVEKANAAKKELNQGESFANVAKKYSIDVNTAEQGGDIGSLSLGTMNSQIAEIIQKMKVNEVSEPIQVMNSYRILRLVKINEGDYYSLEDSKERIKGYLETKKALEKTQSFYKDLKENAKIEK